MGSDFLFAVPSFLRGVASALDIGGTFVEYNQSSSPQEADAKALQSDWVMVGNDLRDAIKTVNG